MARRWNARRVVISAFVIFHLSALITWTMPNCPIKAKCESSFQYYMLPLGIWQWWAIFAPDPIRGSITVNAEVVDAQGMRHVYPFTRLADLSWWERIPRYRNCKFAGNMPSEEYAKTRQFAARHVVRQLDMKPEAFPVWVSMYIELTDPPPPGSGVPDLMTEPRVQVLDRFEFRSPKEVRP